MVRRSRVAGVAVEDALELWASSLREVKRRIRPLFTQERVAVSAGRVLDGLLGPERRKTGWMRAEAAGDPGPWRQQAILGRGRGEADALRDLVRDYALEALADADAVLAIDETGFVKQGQSSCGVARQYTGSAGEIANCRIGVFAAYASRHGHAFIDRALYLPKRPGPTIRPAWRRCTCRPGWASPPSRGWPGAWSSGRSRPGCRSRGWRPTASTAWARWRRRCAGRARVTCSGSTPRSPSTPGAASRRRPARPRRSRAASIPPPGGASRPARGRRVRGCTAGPVWSWPISTPPSTTTTAPAHGRAAC